MTRTGRLLWAQHPHVRSGKDLSVGERAADGLKHWMGTWTILGVIAAVIVFWLLRVHDPGELHLNLALSCMAAVQGVVLQIAANRGDRISAEVAKGTSENTVRLLELQEQQMEILTELRTLRAGGKRG
jgi:uncharacterized membrane protein